MGPTVLMEPTVLTVPMVVMEVTAATEELVAALAVTAAMEVMRSHDYAASPKPSPNLRAFNASASRLAKLLD